MQYSYIPPHKTPAEKNFYANKKPFDLLVKGYHSNLYRGRDLNP